MMKMFGVLDAYVSKETEEKMIIFVSEDYGEIHIKAYPLREEEGEFELRIEAFYTLDECLKCSFENALKYLYELFPNMFEVQDEREVIARIKK